MLRTFLLLLLTSGLVAACDGEPPPETDPSEFVRAAARNADASSARITVVVSGSNPGDGEFGGEVMEGVVDFSKREAELSVDTDPPAKLVFKNGRVYQTWFDTGYWVVSRNDAAGPAVGLTPPAMFDFIARAEDVEVVGTESINGLEATHYRFPLSLLAMPESIRESQKGVSGTVEVWISDDRIHRVLSTAEYGPDAYDGLVGTRIITDTRLSDWGIEVNVEAPAADLIKTMEELQRMD